MKISVIVPVYNGEETIAQCLDALTNQDYPAEDYEVVVINDGSRDNTQQIAEKYPLRLINLGKNCGRVIARERGAQAARYENLLFVDVRVVVAPDILKQIAKIGYQPLMAGDALVDKYQTPFHTLFYLIRRKVYAPYYPQHAWGKELWIDQHNFDQTPKGTTCFFCSRRLFLESIPPRKGKTVSDDTLLLRLMVKQKKLLRHTDLRISYLQRTDWRSVLAHTYQRGPLFADYYLRMPCMYNNLWKAGLGLFFVSLLISFYFPGFLLYLLLGLGLGLLVIALILSENFRDFVIVLGYLPIISCVFGAGIIKGKLFPAS
jgi:glycosyltransferase involved in cell wall biosynthesis